MKLKLNRDALNELRKIGIQGLGIIEFDERLGPVPKYVYSKHSRLIRRILRDQIFSSKVSILAKYACEAKLAGDLRIIIESFDSVGDRIKTNYIIAQISEDADHLKVRALLKTLKKRLNGCREIEKNLIETCLLEAL